VSTVRRIIEKDSVDLERQREAALGESVRVSRNTRHRLCNFGRFCDQFTQSTARRAGMPYFARQNNDEVKTAHLRGSTEFEQLSPLIYLNVPAFRHALICINNRRLKALSLVALVLMSVPSCVLATA
jgi:hypothetical protein